MKRKEGEELPKKRGGNRKKTKQDTSDEEDDCAAVSCLRPSGEFENISHQFLFYRLKQMIQSSKKMVCHDVIAKYRL